MSAGKLLDRPWAVILLIAFLGFGWWVKTTRDQEHHVRVAFDEAVSVSSGLDVQVNGIDVGKVSKVQERDGQAIVELGIDDDAVWPLRHGTTAALRFGTTVGNGTRRIDLVPGPSSAPAIPEGGVIAARHSVTPTEFDQVFQTFDEPTRRDLRGLNRNADGVLRGRADDLDAGVHAAAPALDAVGGVLGDLAADERALRSFVREADDTLGRLASREGRISALVSVGAATFDTFARNSRALQASIDETPSTLGAVRTTLARLDRSVDGLDGLFADLRPGARALRPLAATAEPTLAALRRVVPQARATVHTATRSAPEISRFLADAQPLLRTSAPVLADLAPVVSCLRPYAPELAGFFSNWASFTKNFDGTSHYARVRVVEGQTSLTDTPDLNTKQFLDTAGMGQLYAGLRPPGLNAGKPWYQPECGVGEDAVDPGKDWEDRR
jgi:phospholipid/cholesterol/gamma-HCH transport system substrate-binding protein